MHLRLDFREFRQLALWKTCSCRFVDLGTRRPCVFSADHGRVQIGPTDIEIRPSVEQL